MPQNTDVEAPLDDVLDDVLAAVRDILRTAGAQRVGSLRVSRDVLYLHPTHTDQGQALADALGLRGEMEQTATVPPVTDWCGVIGRLEVHVRGTRPRTRAFA